MGTIQASFDVLVDEGYSPMPALMELYASGELGELMLLSAKKGMYKIWVDQASPTCQYGIYRGLDKVLEKDKLKQTIRAVIKEVQQGAFINELESEASEGYINLKAYDKANDESLLMQTQRKLQKSLKI